MKEKQQSEARVITLALELVEPDKSGVFWGFHAESRLLFGAKIVGIAEGNLVEKEMEAADEA